MAPAAKQRKGKKGKQERTIYDEIEDKNLPVGITDIKSALASELNSTASASTSTKGKQEFKITEHTIPHSLPPEYASGGSRPKFTAEEGSLLSELERKRKKEAGEDEDEDDWELSDLWQAFFLTVPLEVLVVVFDVLVFYQYRDKIIWGEIATRAAKSYLPIWLLLYITHPRSSHPLVQTGFLGAAIAGGCWIVHTVNTEGVFAYMKKVPPAGAMLVWCVVEMNLLPAIIACAAILGFTWWQGYSLM